MKLTISADAWWEGQVDRVVFWLGSTGFWHQFEENDYGTGLEGIGIVLVCREPELNFKRRIRYSRKDKVIYMDIMLSLPEFMAMNSEERKKKSLEALLKEVPEIVRKYKIDDFDTDRFLSDFTQKFTSFMP